MIIGNQKIVDSLKNAVQTRSPFHAYIFDGPKGAGKMTTAFSFAKDYYCENKVNGHACDECAACRKMNGGNHSDFHCVISDGSSIKDEQIEKIQEIAGKKPYDSDRTFIVIDRADTITPRGQNRLLKTLEEPKGNLTIILLTENAGAIAQTVISRCVMYRWKPVDRAELIGHLIDKYHVSDETAYGAAAFSYGNVGKAEMLLNSEEFQGRRRRSIDMAKLLVEPSPLIDFSRGVKDYISSKEEAIEFLDLLAFWFRDAALIQAGVNQNLLLNLDYLSDLKETADQCSKKKIYEISMMIEDAKNDIAINVNINYALRNMQIRIQEENNG